MSNPATSIAETLGRIGDRFARLMAGHLQLLKLEVETEARSVARRTVRQVKAVSIAAPFVIAGVAVLSLGIALTGGRLLESWLNDSWLQGLGMPLAFIVVGALEGVVALRWMNATLRRVATEENAAMAEAERSLANQAARIAEADVEAGAVARRMPGSGDGRRRPTTIRDQQQTMHASVSSVSNVSSAATAAAPREEKTYGAVGRT